MRFRLCIIFRWKPGERSELSLFSAGTAKPMKCCYGFTCVSANRFSIQYSYYCKQTDCFFCSLQPQKKTRIIISLCKKEAMSLGGATAWLRKYRRRDDTNKYTRDTVLREDQAGQEQPFRETRWHITASPHQTNLDHLTPFQPECDGVLTEPHRRAAEQDAASRGRRPGN